MNNSNPIPDMKYDIPRLCYPDVAPEVKAQRRNQSQHAWATLTENNQVTYNLGKIIYLRIKLVQWKTAT